MRNLFHQISFLGRRDRPEDALPLDGVARLVPKSGRVADVDGIAAEVQLSFQQVPEKNHPAEAKHH